MNTLQHRVVNCAPHFKLLHEHAYRIINQLTLLVFCMNQFQRSNLRLEYFLMLNFKFLFYMAK